MIKSFSGFRFDKSARSERLMPKGAVFVVALAVFATTSTHSYSQSLADNVRMLGSGAGIVDACSGNNELAKKLDVLAAKDGMSAIREFLVEGYKKGALELKLWNDGQWSQVSCEKLKASDALESTRKSTTELLDKMIAAE